jgi:hypothetical protein
VPIRCGPFRPGRQAVCRTLRGRDGEGRVGRRDGGIRWDRGFGFGWGSGFGSVLGECGFDRFGARVRSWGGGRRSCPPGALAGRGDRCGGRDGAAGTDARRHDARAEGPCASESPSRPEGGPEASSTGSPSRRRCNGRSRTTIRPPAARRQLAPGDQVVGEGPGDAEHFGGLGDRQHHPLGAVHQRPPPLIARASHSDDWRPDRRIVTPIRRIMRFGIPGHVPGLVPETASRTKNLEPGTGRAFPVRRTSWLTMRRRAQRESQRRSERKPQRASSPAIFFRVQT